MGFRCYWLGGVDSGFMKCLSSGVEGRKAQDLGFRFTV